MTIQLSGDTERLINEELGTGRQPNANALVETALKSYLDRRDPGDRSERFPALRRRIEESGIPLLNDEELRAEICDRRGARS